jgi:hypothetical protein
MSKTNTYGTASVELLQGLQQRNLVHDGELSEFIGRQTGNTVSSNQVAQWRRGATHFPADLMSVLVSYLVVKRDRSPAEAVRLVYGPQLEQHGILLVDGDAPELPDLQGGAIQGMGLMQGLLQKTHEALLDGDVERLEKKQLLAGVDSLLDHANRLRSTVMGLEVVA